MITLLIRATTALLIVLMVAAIIQGKPLAVCAAWLGFGVLAVTKRA